MPLPQHLRNSIPFLSSRLRQTSDLILSACLGPDWSARYTDLPVSGQAARDALPIPVARRFPVALAECDFPLTPQRFQHRLSMLCAEMKSRMGCWNC